MKKDRESSFELLRIIAQAMIVYYHILLFAIYPFWGLPIYKAIWFPLHIGVPLFVLISGYFGINPSIKGFIKFAGMVFVLQLPSTLISIFNEGGVRSVLRLPFFISNSSFWFIRTYFFLYLISPVINYYLKQSSVIKRFYLLLVLFYMSHLIGFLGSDPSLLDGKNIVTFVFYYVLGNTISQYKKQIREMRPSAIIFMLTFFFFNFIVVLMFTFIGFGHGTENVYEKIYLDPNKEIYSRSSFDILFDKLFLDYCSLFLLLNTIIFFLVFVKIHFFSHIVNKIAQASLAIYIIHGSALLPLINPMVLEVCGSNANIYYVLLMVFLVSIVVVLICVFLYLILTPVWNMITMIGDYAQCRAMAFLNRFENKYNNEFL